MVIAAVFIISFLDAALVDDYRTEDNCEDAGHNPFEPRPGITMAAIAVIAVVAAVWAGVTFGSLEFDSVRI